MTEWPKGWLSIINWRLGVPKLPGRPQSAGSLPGQKGKCGMHTLNQACDIANEDTLLTHFLKEVSFKTQLGFSGQIYQILTRCIQVKISAERLTFTFLWLTFLCCFVRSKIAVNCLSSREYWEIKPSCFWSAHAAKPKPCKNRGLPLILTIKVFLFVNLKPNHPGSSPLSRRKGPGRK